MKQQFQEHPAYGVQGDPETKVLLLDDDNLHETKQDAQYFCSGGEIASCPVGIGPETVFSSGVSGEGRLNPEHQFTKPNKRTGVIKWVS